MSLVSVWDGSSSTRPNPNVVRAPDGEDWQRIIKELRDTQQAVLTDAVTFGGDAADVIKPGQPVRIRTTDSKIKLASSSDSDVVAGIAINNAAVTETALFVQVGNLELSDWTQATGASVLAPGRRYYLGPSGMLTLTPPTTGFFIRVGLAVNETTLAIKIHDSIRL